MQQVQVRPHAAAVAATAAPAAATADDTAAARGHVRRECLGENLSQINSGLDMGWIKGGRQGAK